MTTNNLLNEIPLDCKAASFDVYFDGNFMFSFPAENVKLPAKEYIPVLWVCDKLFHQAMDPLMKDMFVEQ